MREERSLLDLLSLGNETLGVEYKAWMDTSEALARANIARHMAALANHGGGHLIFGIDDETRQPQGPTTIDPNLFSQDALSSIVKRYLDPRIQITVAQATHEGVAYPVVIVPGHKDRPIIAIRDGPQKDNRVQGIRMGALYIRREGPESETITTPDEWNALLTRCLTHKKNDLATIIRQALAPPTRPTASATRELAEAMNQTISDYQGQIEAIAREVEGNDVAFEAVMHSRDAHYTLGYSILDERGEPIHIPVLRSMAERASVVVEQFASYGASLFFALRGRGQATQYRRAGDDEESPQYLEGSRLDTNENHKFSNDYWRLYETGVGVTCETYFEDGRPTQSKRPYILLYWVLVRLHSLLIHARFVAGEVDASHQILVRMDWRGIEGRYLLREKDYERVAGLPPSDDRFLHSVNIPFSLLQDDYFEALRRVAVPILDFFPPVGRAVEEWLTRELVIDQFALSKFGSLRFPDDEQ